MSWERENYEMFSGGEAFRINFAIRIALSKLLARRAGAPLPTLVIDEGFGTQDNLGLEKIKRSIEECNSVSTLKEMATLLAQIATQRQGVIRGLVQDMFIFNNVAINQDDLANPTVKSE
jgi:DNA repair exonuclease SbcCD ATPase subunit